MYGLHSMCGVCSAATTLLGARVQDDSRTIKKKKNLIRLFNNIKCEIGNKEL